MCINQEQLVFGVATCMNGMSPVTVVLNALAFVNHAVSSPMLYT